VDSVIDDTLPPSEMVIAMAIGHCPHEKKKKQRAQGGGGAPREESGEDDLVGNQGGEIKQNRKDRQWFILQKRVAVCVCVCTPT